MVCTLLRQDEFQGGGFWEVGRTYELECPFDLSQILPVGGGLLVLCSLPGPMPPECVRPDQGRRFQSVVPLTTSSDFSCLTQCCGTMCLLSSRGMHKNLFSFVAFGK